MAAKRAEKSKPTARIAGRLKDQLRKLGWPGTAAIFAALAACATTLAAFSGSLVSIRENVVKLVTSDAVGPAELTLRDLRAYDAYLWKGSVTFYIEVVIEKKGRGALECEAGVLTKDVEYGSVGADWGKTRQTGDGWWGGGFMPESKISITEPFRQGLAVFYFRTHETYFERSGKFRLDCKSLITSWIPIEIPEPQRHTGD